MATLTVSIFLGTVFSGSRHRPNYNGTINDHEEEIATKLG